MNRYADQHGAANQAGVGVGSPHARDLTGRPCAGLRDLPQGLLRRDGSGPQGLGPSPGSPRGRIPPLHLRADLESGRTADAGPDHQRGHARPRAALQGRRRGPHHRGQRPGRRLDVPPLARATRPQPAGRSAGRHHTRDRPRAVAHLRVPDPPERHVLVPQPHWPPGTARRLRRDRDRTEGGRKAGRPRPGRHPWRLDERAPGRGPALAAARKRLVLLPQGHGAVAHRRLPGRQAQGIPRWPEVPGSPDGPLRRRLRRLPDERTAPPPASRQAGREGARAADQRRGSQLLLPRCRCGPAPDHLRGRPGRGPLRAEAPADRACRDLRRASHRACLGLLGTPLHRAGRQRVGLGLDRRRVTA